MLHTELTINAIMKIALQLMLVVSALLTGLVSAYSVVYPDADWELLKEYHDDSPVHKRVANIHGMHFPRVPGINYDRVSLHKDDMRNAKADLLDTFPNPDREPTP